MGKIQRVLDKNSVEVYPLTHERAVRDSNGVTLETKLGQLQDKVFADFTSLPGINACIDELYIIGYKDGYYISYFYWTGSALTLIIRDGSDNIVLFANGLSVTVGEVFQFSQNDVVVYGILNSTTHLTSPVNATIGLKALSLDENPQVSAVVFAPNIEYSTYTSIPGVNACIDELYIIGYKDGYYINYFYWTGSALTLTIKDNADNVVLYANAISVTQGEVFKFSQNGVTVYGILNSTTYLTSPITATIRPKALSLDENPQICAEVLAPNVEYSTYTSIAGVDACIEELYIIGYRDGYYISYFYWTGTTLIMIIRDSSDNIIWFANNISVTVGEVFEFSQNGVTVYGILNSTTHLTSPITATIGPKALSLDDNPQVGAVVLAPNVNYSPLCVSRFNLGSLPDADHNASWVGIVRRCDDVNDSVFCFANKMAPAVSNHFFDFYSVGTHARGVPYVAEMSTYLDFSGKNGLSTSDALLMPLIVGAVNNIDGDNPTEKWFTGGNHAYGNTATGSPTLREVSNTVRVDGISVPVGKGGVRGRVCTIDLVDRIQGYNTCKEEGGGREIIQENVHIEVTNEYIETTVEFVALESVIVYGPMYASGMNVENMVGYRFIGSQTKRGLYVYNGGNVPGNDDSAINAISIHTADDYVFDTVLDLSYGQGNKMMAGNPNCIVTTSKKAYFVVVPSGAQIPLDEGGSIYYRTRMFFRKK